LGLMRLGFVMADPLALISSQKPQSGDPNKAQGERSAALGGTPQIKQMP
jgi:hypothetical protein